MDGWTIAWVTALAVTVINFVGAYIFHLAVSRRNRMHVENLKHAEEERERIAQLVEIFESVAALPEFDSHDLRIEVGELGFIVTARAEDSTGEIEATYVIPYDLAFIRGREVEIFRMTIRAVIGELLEKAS